MAENEKLEKTEKAKKDKKPEKKDKKPGFFDRVAKWFKDMKGELKKVQWPSKKQTINNTVIVIICVIVVGVVIGAFDFIAGNAIGAILELMG